MGPEHTSRLPADTTRVRAGEEDASGTRNCSKWSIRRHRTSPVCTHGEVTTGEAASEDPLTAMGEHGRPVLEPDATEYRLTLPWLEHA